MRSIRDILALDKDQRSDYYKATNIEKVIIDGNEFTDYSAFSFIWEKSYVKSPVRGGDGSIVNMDSYATFVIPHLKIDFSMMSIDSYRVLMSLLYMKNEFEVTCYDVVNNRQTTNKMYFSTEEMPKLWAIADEMNGAEVYGVQDYVVEMVGTSKFKIPLYVEYRQLSGTIIKGGVPAIDGEDFVVGSGLDGSASYSGLWQLGNGTLVKSGDVVKLHSFGSGNLSVGKTITFYYKGNI